jgi:hypothetical protein
VRPATAARSRVPSGVLPVGFSDRFAYPILPAGRA